MDAIELQEAQGAGKVDHVQLSAIWPSPENDSLYRPVDREDPEIIAMADSMRQLGVLEPFVITDDGWIISGHRRYVAACLADLDEVPCRIVPMRRSDDPGRFVRLLREYNRQRDKSNDEKLREEIISINADAAHEALLEYRREQAAISVETVEIAGSIKRKEISDAKLDMVEAIKKVIEDRRDFWPLSDRAIHYALLNNPPLVHSGKKKSRYRNDKRSYRALTDLLVRMRLVGDIPFEAIDDPTRPVTIWEVFSGQRAFVRRELDDFCRGYSRDLTRSQPNQIEIVGEKNTIEPILRQVAMEYTLPLTTGRGFCSLSPRHKMARRFEKSGKEKLILLFVSDFDPDGQEIAHSFARSMRDDFDIWNIELIQVALTAEQVEQFKLPPEMKTTDKKSTNRKKFESRHGKNVFEVEALAPEQLQTILRQAIENVIDRDALTDEIELEKRDAAFIQGVRQRVMRALSGIDLGNESQND